ncbi:phage head morphogenesis protein, partial [Ornithobacterium rhinotracheale]|uniref:phage head morphogenesis protein n=1 Tax=Ornithobacterium rhinotracheale TaxID=28251 RepID=UPI003FD6A776
RRRADSSCGAKFILRFFRLRAENTQHYFSALHQSLSEQYQPCDCPSCKAERERINLNRKPAHAMGKFKEVLNYAEKAFKKLFEKQGYRPEDLAQITEYKGLINKTAELLSEQIPHETPAEMRQYLEQDVFIFSGLKTHAQLTEARSYLKDEHGNLRTYNDFEQKILSLNKQYNEHYLEAEYEFAAHSAMSASQWANLQSDTERYLLEYRTAGDDRVRAEHDALRGVCLPKNDPFWDSYYPPNGWRCRCVAVEVLADEKTLSDSQKAQELGEVATTKIGKNGKNKLAMFRFNPGQNKKIFPPENTYNKVVGAEKAKKAVEKIKNAKKIDIGNLIKKDIPTNKEVKEVIKTFADKFPEHFRKGLEVVKITSSKSYLMQHSMSYNTRTNEWASGSKISISNQTSWNGFNPLNELKGAFGAIKNNQSLTFNQEYAIESLWHEILHAKTKSKPQNLSSEQIKKMEITNQFVARNTYHTFLEKLGGKAYNQKEILENGYGYRNWVADFRKELKNKKISDEKATKFLEPHLMSDYGNLGEKMKELLSPKEK